jgi:hypothetical protein
MEPSNPPHRPQALIAASLGLGQMLSRLTALAMVLSLPARTGAGAGPLLRPAPQTRWRGKEAWHSYAVYSGALSLRHYKSSRRFP